MALRDSWQTFSSAPHRVMFFAGATQAVLAMLWWAYDLAARYTGLLPYIDWSLPARHGHQFLMIYGLFPLFFFGFIMTAGPRWLDMPHEPLPGDQNLPRIQSPDFGASQRSVVAPGQEESGYFDMPGGQSGHPLSPYYGSGQDRWVSGKPTPFLPGITEKTLLLTSEQ